MMNRHSFRCWQAKSILWVQAQAGLRYVRLGKVSSKQAWQELRRAFQRGGFLLPLFYTN